MYSKLPDNTYEFIKGEVADLFERYDIRCIPISGFELAVHMEITLIPYSILSEKKRQAAMKYSEDGFYYDDLPLGERIYYNDAMPYYRINMTILHEIGHAVLGHNEEMDPEEREVEAKFFAKYAAAPPVLVHRIDPQCPEEIMEVFDIGYEAAVYAFAYYHVWLRHYSAIGRLTSYEEKILKLIPKEA